MEWKQPQSDISLVSWFIENKSKGVSCRCMLEARLTQIQAGNIIKKREKPTIEDYNSMISKAVEDGMLHVGLHRSVTG